MVNTLPEVFDQERNSTLECPSVESDLSARIRDVLYNNLSIAAWLDEMTSQLFNVAGHLTDTHTCQRQSISRSFRISVSSFCDIYQSLSMSLIIDPNPANPKEDDMHDDRADRRPLNFSRGCSKCRRDMHTINRLEYATSQTQLSSTSLANHQFISPVASIARTPAHLSQASKAREADPAGLQTCQRTITAV
jgi:hypothetical protein